MTPEDKNTSEKGTTIVELLTAMVVASIAVYILLYMWNNINLHVADSKYRTELELETTRIGDQIALQMQKSRNILEWDDHRILMLNAAGTDTIHYNYYRDTLFLNGKPLGILVKRTRVAVFELKNLNDYVYENSDALLLNLTLTIVGREKDSLTVNRKVQISQKVPKNSGGEKFWGF